MRGSARSCWGGPGKQPNPPELSCPVLHIGGGRMLGAVRAAEEPPTDLDAVPDDAAFAMLALWSQGMDRALKAVKDMPLPRGNHFEGLVVIVPANFTCCHRNLLEDETLDVRGVVGVVRLLCSRSVEVDLLKSKRVQQAGESGTRILLRGIENAVGKRGLLEIMFGLLTHLGFQVRIHWNKQAGLAGVHPGFRTIQPGREQLGGRHMQADLAAVHRNIAGTEGGEINAGDNLPVDEEQQAISGQEIG